MKNSIQQLSVNLPNESYDILIGRGLLDAADAYLPLARRVLILTDDGVPAVYAATVADAVTRCGGDPVVETMKQGEKNKALTTVEQVLSRMLNAGFTRSDCLVAVGGGVVGDLGGLTASLYMRGIDFYNLPTTLLSQVDSSIGGKTAVNLCGIKNAIGAFYQPRRVLIDLDTLHTLPSRQISQGLAEALKMSLTHDAALFSLFESGDPLAHLEEIVYASLSIKRSVVEQDEKETGLRRVLNFGHTVGHGIESRFGLDSDRKEGNGLYHGECVALGMLPMCGDDLKERLRAVLRTLSLPTEISLSAKEILEAMHHDKKATATGVHAVLVEEPGSFVLRDLRFDQLEDRITATFG